MIDEAFIGRVYKSSFWWSVGILGLLLTGNALSLAAGFGIGVAVALAGLKSIETVVHVVLVPGNPGLSKVKMALFGLAKYVVLGVVIRAIAKSAQVSLPAFACGIGVPSAIIMMKMLAHFFSEFEFHPFWGSSFDPGKGKETA